MCGWGLGMVVRLSLTAILLEPEVPILLIIFGRWWQGGPPYSKPNFIFFAIRKYTLKNSVILNCCASVCSY